MERAATTQRARVHLCPLTARGLIANSGILFSFSVVAVAAVVFGDELMMVMLAVEMIDVTHTAMPAI